MTKSLFGVLLSCAVDILSYLGVSTNGPEDIYTAYFELFCRGKLHQDVDIQGWSETEEGEGQKGGTSRG